jgi:hypothetical protein
MRIGPDKTFTSAKHGSSRFTGHMESHAAALDEHLLVISATDIASTQRQAIQVDIKFNPKCSVSGTRNQNGGFGADGR